MRNTTNIVLTWLLPAILGVAMSLSLPVYPAAGSESDSALTALRGWVDSVNAMDYAAVENFIASDFRSTDWPTKQDFVRYIRWRLFSDLSLQYVRSEHLADTVTFSGIAALDASQGFYAELVVSMRLREGDLQIVSAHAIGPTESRLTKSLYFPGMPEQVSTLPVSVSLADAATARPVSARVSIIDSQGVYWPPRGHQKYVSTAWRESVGGDVVVSGRTYAYVAPHFTADLAPGEYEIRIEKGMEYQPLTSRMTIVADKENSFEFRPGRWIDMRSAGWASGDTHAHFLNDYDAILEAEAEGLNIVNVLATKWGNLITDASSVRGKASAVSKPDHIVYYNEEIRHGFLGHVIVHPLRKPIFPLSWGGPTEGVLAGADYPTIAHLADEARSQGALVTWAHFPYPEGEVAVDVALGKVDSVDLLTWNDPFDEPMATDNDGSPIPSAVDWWYKFLNTGFRLPVSAGTDKMFNYIVTGSARTYVHLGEQPLTYMSWASALREGRSFVTTGPMLSLTVNGRGIGSVLNASRGERILIEASVEAPHSRFPWERFEIIQNGKVIAARSSNGADRARLLTWVPIDGSSWVASRVYVRRNPQELALDGTHRIPPVAHTSPIYIRVPGSVLWNDSDAKFLADQCQKVIEWAKNRATYHSGAQRQAAVDTYERGRAVYQDGGAR